MRTRTDVLDTTLPFKIRRQVNDGPWSTVINKNYDRYALYHKIIDRKGKGRNNPCLHIKLESDYYPASNYRYTIKQGSSTYYHHIENGDSVVIDDTQLINDVLLGDIPRVTDQDLLLAAYENLKPTMESGFEVTNFILELKELPSLFKWWDRSAGFARNASQNSLNYNFGVKPFLSDCQSLYNGLKDYQGRLRAFLDGAKTTQRRHAKFSFNSSIDKEYKYASGFRNPQLYYGWTFEGERSSEHYVTMTYRYSVPDMSADEYYIRGLLDTIGLQLDAYVVWNAIPYSFVLDWFFDIGDILKRYRKPWLSPSVRILDTISTRKVSAHADQYRHPYYPNNYFMGAHMLDYYQRRILSGDSIGEVLSRVSPLPSLTGGVTLRKVFLGSLLVEQRIPWDGVKRRYGY